MKIKIGLGVDIHKLEVGREFWLGGIQIPYEKGCVAHSDGDVLIHSICDAMFGAAGMEDIGSYFPDTAKEYKDIDSKKLLRKTYDMISKHGFVISNIDCVVMLQKPKLKPYIMDMRECLAEILDLDISDIAIKATTGEEIGYVGRGEGVQSFANVLLYKL